MSGKNREYGGAGMGLIRRLSAEGERVFSTARARQLAVDMHISESYFRQVLHHLARSGWLVRLRKGLYAISPTVPGVNPAHELEIAMHLANPAAISHWSALSFHGLTDQVPALVYVQTTSESSVPRARGEASVDGDGFVAGGTRYRFVQVIPQRFFGVRKVWVAEARVAVTDLERSLLDGLARPGYCGDFGEVLSAFERAIGRLDVPAIIDQAMRLGKATVKRLGWALEQMGIGPEGLRPLLEVPISGYRKLDPSGPRKGPYNSRWMIRENLPGRVGR